jgi:hypothetical protein
VAGWGSKGWRACMVAAGCMWIVCEDSRTRACFEGGRICVGGCETTMKRCCLGLWFWVRMVASNNVNSVGGASGVGTVRAGGGSPLSKEEEKQEPRHHSARASKDDAAEISGTTPRPFDSKEQFKV